MSHVNKKQADRLIKKNTTIIDLRNPVAFRDGHIDGAKNLTLKYFLNYLMTIKDKKTSMLVYGDTFTESDLSSVMTYADQLGFSKIKTGLYHEIK